MKNEPINQRNTNTRLTFRFEKYYTLCDYQ